VATGAADDGRHRLRQLAAGVLGWLLWAGLIAWLALHASGDALDVATFLATVVATVALLTVLTALALRPAVMRRRARSPAISSRRETDT
jgi:membrane protein implicated in regulation of membrane protease activity